MKFQIVSAKVAQVAKAGANFGKEYIDAVVVPDSMFMSAEHRTMIFPTPAQMPAWKAQIDAINSGSPMAYPAKYVVVKVKTPYQIVREGKVLPNVHTEMRVLVMVDPDNGEAIESADGIAAQTISNMIANKTMVAAQFDAAPMVTA
jgi:hypothetical protein